jgi:hypothetical protein
MIEEKIVNVEVTNHAGVIVMCPCGTWSSSVREALEEDSKELLQEDAAVTVTEKYFCEVLFFTSSCPYTHGTMCAIAGVLLSIACGDLGKGGGRVQCRPQDTRRY